MGESLPRDAVMLLSVVNTQLRDRFDGPEEFCAYHNVTRPWLEEQLGSIDYQYDPERNQYV